MGGGGNGAEWREGHGVGGYPDCITPTVSTSHSTRMCGLLKLLILSLTSKEYSGAQQIHSVYAVSASR